MLKVETFRITYSLFGLSGYDSYEYLNFVIRCNQENRPLTGHLVQEIEIRRIKSTNLR